MTPKGYRKGNATWTDGEIGYIEISSRKYGTFIAKVDADRVPETMTRTWVVQSTKRGEARYANSTSPAPGMSMHSFLFPDCPPGLVRDHINGDGFDNRQENIRFVTKRENCLNRRSRKYASGVGFIKETGRFRAYVGLGTFATEEEAHQAWQEASSILASIR